MRRYEPYPAYKDSRVKWLGNVPEHWELAQFKRVVTIRNGSDHKAIESAEGYPVYGSGGHFAYATDYIYDGESILLGRKGTIDKPLYVNEKFWTVDTMYWTEIKPNAHGRFCYYAATTIPFEFYASNTALPSMTQTDLGSHVMAFPSRDEQACIAIYLDRETARIDTLIQKKTRFIKLLKEKRQALITHAVTRGLGPNVPIKDSGVEWLGDVPEHWRIAQFKRLVTIKNGSDHKSIESDTGFPVYGSGGVFSFAKEYIYDGESILLGRKGTIDKPLYVNGKFWTVDTMYWTKIMPNTNGKFCYYVAKTIPFNRYSTNTALPSMTQTDLGSHIVALPDEDEQVKIAAFLDRETARIDTLMTKTQWSIDLLKERRSAFITAAVTGQIDLRKGQ